MTLAIARFLLAITILLAAAEFMTRHSEATVRWGILASCWLVVVIILFWAMGLG